MKKLNYKLLSLILLCTLLLVVSFMLIDRIKINKYSEINNCYKKVKLVNELNNQLRCTDYDTINYKCNGVYVSKSSLTFNYSKELEKCLSDYK